MGKRNGGHAVTEHDHNKEFGYYVPRTYWKSRVAPYAGEWAAAGVIWAAGAGTHLLCADSEMLPWVTPGLTLLGTGLSALAWKAGAARGMLTRLHATATTALGGLWMTTCSIVAPWSSPLSGIYLYGGAAVALSWNIRRMLNSGGDNGESGTGSLFDKIKLAGVRTGPAVVTPNKVTVPLALPAGEVSIEDVQAKADKVAQVLGLHKGSVRIVGDPDNLSKGVMAIVPQDVLRHPQPWPGPSSPGGSITDALVPGLYEDNEPQRIYLPGDKKIQRNATHYVVVGMNGSGKSHGAKLTWTEILTRRDAALVVLDPSKGEQTVGFLGKGAHVVIGQKPCKDFMSRVVGTVTERANQLGKWGYDQWTPEVFTKHGMPYLVVWVEEAPRVLEDASTVTRIAQEARSAGISVVLSLQKASFRQMNTDIRSQLGGVWCFGVNEIDDAAFVMSEDTIAAGARPDRWKNRRPGCNYLEGPGMDETRFAVPGRTFDVTDAQMSDEITAHEHIRPGLGEVTATALGLPERPGPATTTTKGAAVTTSTDQSVTTVADHSDLDSIPLSDQDDELAPLPEVHEPDLDVDPDMELPEDPDMELPGGRPTRKQALEMVWSAITELTAQGATTITVRDLPDPAQLGRSRSWLSGVLGGFARDGRLVEDGTDGSATRYTLPVRNAA
ncbi:plasmid transfer protein TraB [Umezawaea sp. Da 62-37]|uniref:plasmid transfer protein TraB n=1 Tax=Umezawaea sp. Da 62-37 TaxID=3075927 RepID=UPI0028F6D969|nr:plasmid transfer protein TraB [Umezawaea sp. Da 62-37]WNV83242.1 plasmid transfer protein TraB [Umezawaea sp. Da 62-37]